MASRKLKIYIWDNVLCDYSSGIIVVCASSVDNARKIAKDAHPSERNIDDNEPIIMDIKQRYIAECYGGG